MRQPRLHLNLASEPFRRDRPIFVASVALSALLGIALLAQIWLIVAQHGQAADARSAAANLETQIEKLDREQSQIAGVLRQPQNAEVFEQSVFLNTLLARKAISWTRIFSDLESVVPHNVRLVSVRPQIGAQNQVVLDLYVGSMTPEPVIDMLMKLETSPVFGRTTIVNSLPPSQSEPFYRFRLTVNYAQKL